MDFLWDAITEWLKELLVGGITSNLSGMFDSVNQKVAEISGQVGMTPQGWNGSIYNMIHNLSETVIVPIAGVILAFVMTLELIQIITDKNNFHEIETAVFFKWIFKTGPHSPPASSVRHPRCSSADKTGCRPPRPQPPTASPTPRSGKTPGCRTGSRS